MATEKTKTEASAVENRLKSLYELQTVLSEVDRLKIIRGELPLEVKDLEDQLEGLHTRVANYQNEIAELQQAIATNKEHARQSATDVERFKEQLNRVRNNAEFDALNKQIENFSLDIEVAEKRNSDNQRLIETRQGEIEATEAKIAEAEHLLTDKKKELEEIMGETRQDEERLREKAKKIEAQVDDERLLSAFKRIRRNARNGLGVVYIQRNACGGCFNRIPPQKQLEIRLRKKIIVCEYCGRIIIDPELAGIHEEADKPADKK